MTERMISMLGVLTLTFLASAAVYLHLQARQTERLAKIAHCVDTASRMAAFRAGQLDTEFGQYSEAVLEVTLRGCKRQAAEDDEFRLAVIKGLEEEERRLRSPSLGEK